ncbi:MAG TPA: PLP-dependent aminotransferase family protein [Hyphomicrobium sp.]|nr:PLP-dependent aminotransferase family protein [Hyphomicrobium sp.]
MLRPWQLSLALTRGRKPVSQQIVHAVIEDVRRGRLTPGFPLPGSRELGEALGINRKTVMEAYAELEAQGWVSTESRRGTFVAENLPQMESVIETKRPRVSSIPAAPFFKLPRPEVTLSADLAPSKSLSFNDGAPDIRHVPIEVVARAYRNGLRSTLQLRRLGYGDPRGSEGLRSALAAMLTTDRGLAAKADNICLTRGSQMGIFLAAQTLVTPGDTVVVETLSYPPAREAFRRVGAEIATVSVDANGISVEDLERVCRRKRVRAVYVTPHHHFPTTVCMTPERRMRLILLAAQFGFAIVEDDYDHEFHFSHQPMLPLASSDTAGHVIYIGSLSKLLSPSLRLGYVCAPKSFIDRIAGEVMMIDRQGDSAMEAAMTELIEAGEIQRHTRKMRRLYSERRTTFADELKTALRSRGSFNIPEGGLAFWVRFEGIDLKRLAARCRDKQLYIQLPDSFSSTGQPINALRLGFASLDVKELRTATGRLGAALAEIRR